MNTKKNYFSACLLMVFILLLCVNSTYSRVIEFEDAQKQEYFEAINTGDIEKVKMYLSNHPNLLEETNEQGFSPLLFAANADQTEIAKYLVKKGANIHFKNAQGYQAIHLAAKNGNIDLVKLLIEKGVSVNEKVADGTMPINFAAWSGDFETAVYLEKNGADYMAIVSNNASLLMWSALGGNTAIYDRYEEKGVSRDVRDNDGDGPLHWAASGESTQMVKHLVNKKKYDINEKNNKGATPLQIGLEWGKLNTSKAFFELGISPDTKNSTGGNCLHSAARTGNAELIEYLIEKECDINAHNSNGATPINDAASSGNLRAVELMVRNGAKVNPKDCLAEGCNKVDGSPLHNSVWRNPEIVKYLIKQGANVNALNADKQTPLHISTFGRCIDCVRALVDGGADLNKQDKYGKTPLHHAIKREKKEIANYLVNQKVDISLKDKTGKTVVHLAAICGFCDVIDKLIENGGDVKAKDNLGNTPLYYANYYGNLNTAKKLLAAGAPEQVFNMPNYCHKEVKNGEATVWYLNHSGWAVKTQNNLLVFDYWQPNAAPDKPCVNNGYICAEEMKDQKVTVFVSHNHSDHYDKSIFDWKNNVEDITYVMGFNDEIETEYTYIKPQETQKVGNIKVTPIKSTDAGEGFLVEVDGVTIYHPGDHANDNRNNPVAHNSEIDFLAQTYSNIDIAFFPISGCSFRDKVALKQGVKYTVEKLNPNIALPMHASTREDIVFPEFAKEANEYTEVTEFISSINYKGDRYFYSPKNETTQK